MDNTELDDNIPMKSEISNQTELSTAKTLRANKFYWILTTINLGISVVFIPICYFLWDNYLSWLVTGFGISSLVFIIFIISVFLSKKDEESTSPNVQEDQVPIDTMQQKKSADKPISPKDFVKSLSPIMVGLTTILAWCSVIATYFIIEIETEYYLIYLIIDICIMAFFIIMPCYKFLKDYREMKALAAKS